MILGHFCTRFRQRGYSFSRAAIGGVLVLAAACSGAPGNGPPGAAGRPGMDGRAAGPVAVVATQVSARPFIDRFTALGTARSNESIDVTARISSIVTRIAFDEGERVEAGELLVELDDTEIAANLAMAQAALQKVRSQYDRRAALAATRVISEAELEELGADVAMAEAEVRANQARLRNSVIRAPFGGTVGLRRVSPGDLVGPETVITTLDDTATIKLEFTVPESYLGAIDQGMDIVATTDVYRGRAFNGAVTQIDPRIDPTTRAVTVIAELPNVDRALKPGMFLTINVERAREDVLLIPEEALMPRQGRQFVYVVEDGRAVEREVGLGVRAPGLAEVRTGLSSGALVITEGAQKVRDGMPVRVVSNS